MTSSILIAGLEPFDTYEQVLSFIKILRTEYKCEDTVVIYTGYTENEIFPKVEEISSLGNIVIKYGRYNPIIYPNSRFDSVLGITLATENQYAREYNMKKE